MRSYLALLAVVAVLLAPLPASAEGTGAIAIAKVNTASDAAGITRLRQLLQPASFPISPMPGKAKNLLHRVQGYGCRACRRACVEDFKIDCEESERWCRRQFVRCMRVCWEEECR